MIRNGKKKEKASAPEAKHLRVREKILDWLLSPEGESAICLPRELDLCRKYRVSRTTVARALASLSERGIVRRVRHKGTLIVHRKLASVRKERNQKRIGVLFPPTDGWRKAVASMRAEAARLGCELTVYPYTWSSLEDETRVMERAVKENGGLILYPGCLRNDRELIDSLDRRGVPIVLFDLYFENSSVGCVVGDNYLGGFLATEYLIRAGRRRIGLISMNLSESSTSGRADGYRAALRQYGLPVSEDRILDLRNTFDPRRIRDYFRKQKPDAVFVTNHMEAVQIRYLLSGEGGRMSSEILLAKFDALPCEPIDLSIPTILQPEEEMGRLAVLQLFERMNNPALPHRKSFVVPKLISASAD